MTYIIAYVKKKKKKYSWQYKVRHIDISVELFKSRVSCQKGPTRHAYAWQIGPVWQDTLEMWFPRTAHTR